MTKGCSEGDVASAPPLAIFSWSVLTSPGLVPPTLAHCKPTLEFPAQIPPQPQHRLAPSIAGLGGVKDCEKEQSSLNTDVISDSLLGLCFRSNLFRHIMHGHS